MTTEQTHEDIRNEEIQNELNCIMEQIDDLMLDIVEDAVLSHRDRYVKMLGVLGTLTQKYYFECPYKKDIFDAYNSFKKFEEDNKK